jgi:hypothetical protein
MSAMACAGHGQGVPAGAQRGEIEPGLRVTTDQITLFVLLLCVFGLLIWGRWRYDLVAFTALLVALVAGVVPSDQAFAGFGHPATVVIALVLLLSRGLMNSGVIDLAARYLVDRSRSLTRHIGLMATAAAALSAVMNNVAALAVLMPLDIEAAAKAKRSPALTLMPLSFATILGGMITLIGTPPNIIVAAFRERALGAPFDMFDFAPVGLVCAAVGVVFVAAFGWRLIPAARSQHDSAKELSELDSFIAEVRVSADSSAIGKKVRELYEVADEHEIAVLGLVRRGRRLPGLARREEIKKGEGFGSGKFVLKIASVDGSNLKGDAELHGTANGDIKSPLTKASVKDGTFVGEQGSAVYKLKMKDDKTLTGTWEVGSYSGPLSAKR